MIDKISVCMIFGILLSIVASAAGGILSSKIKVPIQPTSDGEKVLQSTYPVPAAEMSALKDLFESAGGPHWVYRGGFTHWNFTSPTANPCTEHWQGVTCQSVSPYNHVKRLFMPGMNLVGSIPNTLTALEYLSSLSLSFNALNGTIPINIGNFTTLEYLDLGLNALTGSLPHSLTNLHSVEYLDFSVNALTGTLPAVLGRLEQLLLIDVGGNQLTGTIPCELSQLKNLQGLHLFDNQFTGTLPECICNYSFLTLMDVGSNQLSGTLPSSIGDMLLMRSVYMYNNAFTGFLPESFHQLTELANLEVYNNLLSGVIPPSYGSMRVLNVFAIYSNRLTGTIPVTLGQLSLLNYFYLNSNSLSGKFPTTLSNLTQLRLVDVHDNYLSGTIPEYLGNNSQLQFLVLYGNQFSGTLPNSLSNLTQLIELQLQDNHLSGTLERAINASNQASLAILQVDNNQFTGNIPDEIFLLPQLTTVVAVSNCMRGQLPQSVCKATSLTTLVLDGISSARACRSSLLPPTSSAYITRFQLRGTIPACLLQLPLINTLHLSGNGFTGTLPNVVASESLVDLSIAHNLLTGTIPHLIQQRRWARLDVSYNRLTGTLSPDFSTFVGNLSTLNIYEKETGINLSVSPTLHLEDNRLSGKIPHSIRSFINISVLSANIFSCELNKEDLPTHDNAKDNYQCGSDSFDTPYYLWLGLVGLTALVLLYGVIYPGKEESVWKALGLRIRMWIHATTLYSDTRIYFRRLYKLAQVMQWSAALILVGLLPLYITLNHYFGTVVHSYAWQASAAYLSGATAVCCEYVLLVALMVTFVITFSHYFPLSTMPIIGLSGDSQKDRSILNLRVVATAAVSFILVNIFVVVGVNAAFVYVAIYSSSTLLIISQILISLFKIGWNNYCTTIILRIIVKTILSEDSANRLDLDFGTLQIFVALLINIAIPCLVVMAISPDCFYQLFEAAPSITSLFSYPSCVLDDNFDCIATVPKVSSTSYDPPFRYSYQCSSSLITFYAPAYVFLCLVLTFAAPLAQLLVVILYQNTVSGTWLNSTIKKVLPSSLRPLSEDSSTKLENSFKSVFAPTIGANRAMIVVWTFLGLLLTFGAMFPPLAAALAVTLMVTIAGLQLRTGRLLIAAVRLGRTDVIAVVEKECACSGSIEVLRNSMWMIVTTSCLFYTLFLFDTFGNAVGFANAYWILIVTPLLPVVIWLMHEMSLLKWRTKSQLTQQETLQRNRSVSTIEMQSIGSHVGTMADPVVDHSGKLQFASLNVALESEGSTIDVYNAMKL